MSGACSVNVQLNIAQSIMTEESVDNNTKPNISSPSKFEIANESATEINYLLDIQENKSAELCCARVKLAKKQFFINIIEMTASLIAFTVSVGMTVCSGGTTAPLAVLTGLNLVSSLANLACAYHNWDCASKGKPELTMGNDALQQLVFILAKNAQVSPSNAKKIARITSYLIKTGIFVALGAVGFVIHPMINSSVCLLARNYAPILTSMLSTAATGVLSTWIGNNNDEIESALDKLIENEKEVVHQIALLEGKLTTIVG
ncbi:hypothetical protein [Yersinia sp. Marseille-Q3913]|uniref:hypothetical protein n=1 Tax=Yersinia sp. Marseille-Q3913 TaxID=2830769 RepID=UPI001BAFAF86|nr:hypothetical protein [Yersinia sp. Marseille-Q3913]MBS0056528.1 hypothetical protein [Yersinia sp. Marseille-Q3913]